MITVTPFWFVESGVYNSNFDLYAFFMGGILLIICIMLILPFLIGFALVYLDDDKNHI